MSRTGIGNSGFPADHIVTLTERQATAANIRSGLQWLVERSGPNAFSVFHYSGHVKQMSGDRDRDGEKLDEFLWPHDDRFLADAELAAYARRLQGLAWVDIAGCEAAGFDDGISGPTRLFTASSRENGSPTRTWTGTTRSSSGCRWIRRSSRGWVTPTATARSPSRRRSRSPPNGRRR